MDPRIAGLRSRGTLCVAVSLDGTQTGSLEFSRGRETGVAGLWLAPGVALEFKLQLVPGPDIRKGDTLKCELQRSSKAS